MLSPDNTNYLKLVDIPHGVVRHNTLQKVKNMKFKDCGNTALGIYPVVDRAYKLRPLYEVGITTAQLRTKDKLYGDRC